MLLLDDLLHIVEVQSCMYLQAGPVQVCYRYSSNSGYNKFDKLWSEAIAFVLGERERERGRGRGREKEREKGGGARIEENALSLWFSGVESVRYIAKQMF